MKATINSAMVALALAVSFCALAAEDDMPHADEQHVQDNDPEQPLAGLPDAPQEIQPQLSAEQERDRLFRKDLVLRLNEVVEKVQTHHPALAGQLSHDDKNRLLKEFADSLNAGVEYLRAGERSRINQTEKPDDNAVFPSIIMSSKKTLYVRMDSFSTKAVSQLEEDMTSVFRLVRPPTGFIMDLRNSQSPGTGEVLRALKLFVHGGKIPAPEKTEPGTDEPRVTIPVLLLVGHKTSGAAELFSFLLSSLGKAMSIGEKTAGNPFPQQRLQLSNGDFLLIPKMPEFIPLAASEQVSPAIKAQAYPQIDFEHLRNTIGAEVNDNCLNRAVELLVCLHALTPEQK